MTFGSHPFGPAVGSRLNGLLHRARNSKCFMEQPTAIKNLNNRVGNRRIKGRRSSPMAENRRVAIHHNPYAWTFKDANVGTLTALNADQGAWWIGEEGKVRFHKLVDAWKLDANDEEAIFYAGITIDQLKHFQKLHPDVYTIKHLCKQNLGLLAKKNFAKKVENGEADLVYLRMKRKDEGYSYRIEATGSNGRELLDGLTEQVRKMLETENNDDDEYYDESKEYVGSPDAGHTDAGPERAGDEATPTEDKKVGEGQAA